MAHRETEILRIHRTPKLKDATLVLAFSGWMDGGDVSTGTVQRVVSLLDAKRIAEIDPETYYIYNFPGSMELTALFRPHVVIDEGLVKSYELPSNEFFSHDDANLVFFLGKEPNLCWRSFGDCIFRLAHEVGVTRIVFIGSFGGTVPHTREPRLYVACSDAKLMAEMEQYGLLRSDYAGPGSFTSYLMTRAESEGLQMLSLVAEIPGYLQGTNPLCIEAVTRRLAKILQLPLDLASLRSTSNEWEFRISNLVEKDEDLAEEVRKLEEQYDNKLLELDDS